MKIKRFERLIRAIKRDKYFIQSRLRRPSPEAIPFILLSFPRSGSHWTRYIIEWCWSRPTVGYSYGIQRPYRFDPPIGLSVPMRHVDLSAPVIAKKQHRLNEFDDRSSGLILIVRNFKEAVVRHAQTIKGTRDSDVLIPEELETKLLDDYWHALSCFDSWTSPKHLIYYEALVDNPKPSVLALLEFMGLPDAAVKTENFFKDEDWHRRNSIDALINPSASGGKLTKFHEDKLAPDVRRRWEENLMDRNPRIFDQYLKRYLG